jgi:hypothetical protein
LSVTIAASIVLYHNCPEVFGAANQVLLDCGSEGRIAVVDNSGYPLVHDLFQHERATYMYVGRNLGCISKSGDGISMPTGLSAMRQCCACWTATLSRQIGHRHD